MKASSFRARMKRFKHLKDIFLKHGAMLHPSSNEDIMGLGRSIQQTF
jgi:hypothetical protein